MSQGCKINSINYCECQAHHKPWEHICETGIQQRIEMERKEALTNALKIDSVIAKQIAQVVFGYSDKGYSISGDGHIVVLAIIQELRRRAGLDEVDAQISKRKCD